jgi:hypothetical protein
MRESFTVKTDLRLQHVAKTVKGYPFMSLANSIVSDMLLSWRRRRTAAVLQGSASSPHRPGSRELCTLCNYISTRKKKTAVDETRKTSMISAIMCELRASFNLTVCVEPILCRIPRLPAT